MHVCAITKNEEDSIRIEDAKVSTTFLLISINAQGLLNRKR